MTRQELYDTIEELTLSLDEKEHGDVAGVLYILLAAMPSTPIMAILVFYIRIIVTTITKEYEIPPGTTIQ